MLFLLLVGFAFSQFKTCTNISSSGAYSLQGNLTGNGTWGGGACIYINASNVDLDCKGHNISGTVASTNTTGIYVSSASNVTIYNCPEITGYGIGIRLGTTQNSTIHSINIRDSYVNGLFLSDANYNDIYFVNVSNSSSHGIRLYSSVGNEFENSSSHNNNGSGVYIYQVSNNNTFFNVSSFENNNSGFYEDSIRYTGYEQCSAVDNGEYGFYARYSEFTNYLNNTAYSNWDSGFYLRLSHDNFMLGNNATYNGEKTPNGGIYLYNSENNTLIDNLAADNLGHGINLESSNKNNLTGNTALNNTQTGVYLLYSNNNTLANNFASANGEYGFVLTGSTGADITTNNVLDSNNASNNSMSGFRIEQKPAYYNNLTNNIAYNNSENGFVISNADGNLLYFNYAYENLMNGFLVESNANANILDKNFAHDNAGYGFSMTSGQNNITSSHAYNNSVGGFYLTGGFYGLSGNHAFENGGRGFDLLACSNSVFSGTIAYRNSQHGIMMTFSQNNTFTNSVFYDNLGYGIYILNSSVNNSFSSTQIYNQTYYFFQQATAAPANNFTDLTLGYNSSIGRVRFDNIPATNLYLNTSNLLLYPDWVSLNDSAAPEANKSANITITGQPNYVVYRGSGFPQSRAAILAEQSTYPTSVNCVGTDCTFSVSGFSGYTLDEPGCLNLSDPSTWLPGQVVNVSGVLYINENTTLCTDHYYIFAPSNTPAVRMNASNIYLNCRDSIIEGNHPNGYGIYVGMLENVTVENCRVMYFDTGFYDNRSVNSLYLNDTSYQNAFAGFVAEDSSYARLYNVSASGHAYNIYIAYSNYSVVENCTLSQSNNYGVAIAFGMNNTVSGCSITDSGTSMYHAIGVLSSPGNKILNNTIRNVHPAVGIGSGIWTDWHDNTISNNVISNCSGGGVHIQGVFAYGNLVENNTAYENNYGFLLNASSNNLLSSNTARNNTDAGFRLINSSGNNFTDTVAYGNAGYGLYFSPSSSNILVNTIVHSQGNYIYLEAGSLSNFTNLTLGYNETVGLINYPSMNLTSGIDLAETTNIYLRPDWVSLDGNSQPQADIPAYVTINNSNCASLGVLIEAGFPSSLASILANGFHYPTVKTCNGDLATFYVDGFSGYTLGQQISTCSLTFDPFPGPITYGTLLNASCSCTNPEAPATLWRNNTDVTATENNQFVLIPAGIWDYACNVTATGNYTNASNSSIYTINKATTAITSFTATPPSPTTFGNETNVSCAVDNPQVTITIYQNGTPVASGTSSIEYLANLTAGSYLFVCNTTGNENYTNASGAPIYYTVNKITTTLNLSINTSSWTVRPGTPTNVSCTANTNLVTVELWRAGVLVDSGAGYAEDADTLAAGSYLYVCNTTGNENYTSQSASNTLNVRVPSGGGEPSRCYLEIIAPEYAFTNTPVRVGVRKDDGTLLYRAKLTFTYLDEPAGSAPATSVKYTDIDGYSEETYFLLSGRWKIYAEFADCEMDEEIMQVYEAGGYQLSFEPACDGSTVTVTTEVCEPGYSPEPGTGSLACRQAPVPGVGLDAYFCPAGSEDCTLLIGSYTTDSSGTATILAFDGRVKVVMDTGAESEPIVQYFELPSSAECPPPTEEISIDFDPSCDGSTITVTGTLCTGGTLLSDVSSAPYLPYGECSEGPLSGMRVNVYCCPESWERMDLQPREACTRLVDSGTTDSAGVFVTDARDCTALISVERLLDTHMEGTYITAGLPTTEECGECVSDSDCPEGYVCRDRECVPRETPPWERRCSADPDCTTGYRCSGGTCTQIVSCFTSQECPAGYGCLEGVCYTEEEIQEIRGREGVEGEGLLPSIIGGIYYTVVRSAWLIGLLILLLLLFWFFWLNKKKKKKRLTQEEMIAKEQEGWGAEPRQPRRK